MKVQFALCAQTATVDRATNRLSLVNVIDLLSAVSFPLYVPNIAFACVLESEGDNEGIVKGFFQILSNDVLLGASDVPINFTENRLARIVLNLQGIPVQKPGPLTFRLTLPNGFIAETRFQVISVAPREALQTVAQPSHS